MPSSAVKLDPQYKLCDNLDCDAKEYYTNVTQQSHNPSNEFWESCKIFPHVLLLSHGNWGEVLLFFVIGNTHYDIIT